MFPPSVHDPEIGGRLDLGEEIDGGKKRRLKFQLNKNAKNATLKEKAAEDSHKVHATVDVDPNQEATEENVRKMFDELKGEAKG